MRKEVVIVMMAIVGLLCWNSVDAASFLEDEAGISASTKLTGVNLTTAETAFKTIDRRDDTYILGSVALDPYPENYDVHVYLDASGDMVAYYLNTEPAAKIVDWVGYAGGGMSLEGSKLEDALTKVANTMGLTLPEVTYYDFRYPLANQIKIIADEMLGVGEETFFYTIPVGLTIYGKSASLGVNSTNNSGVDVFLKFDDTNILSYPILSSGWQTQEIELAEAYVTTESQHEVLIISGSSYYSAYGAVVLVYQESE